MTSTSFFTMFSHLFTKLGLDSLAAKLPLDKPYLLVLYSFSFYLMAYKVPMYFYRQQKMKDVLQKAINVLLERNSYIVLFKVRDTLDVQAIISMDVEALQKGLRAGQFTSYDLVSIFGSRCQTIGRNLCLSAEENFEEALRLAALRDKEREEARAKGSEALEALSMMHGIPFSVKDMFNQKGKLSTVGCAFLCADEFRAHEDATVVQLYLRAGAIPLVRGNVPQSALSLHTKNLIFGEARNPLDQERSCGGSSGGESGLVTARCIPCGIGSDVGGSLRFPAAFCGIYGFKPTSYRVSRRGVGAARRHRFHTPGHLRSVIGPIGSSVQDLIINSQILFAPDIQYFDPLEAPVPFKQEELDYVMSPTNFKKIKIGILEYNTFLDVTDATKRAMNLAKDALTKLGYDVVPIKFDQDIFVKTRKAFMGLVAQNVSTGLAKDFIREYETPLKPLENNVMILEAGTIKRKLIDFLLKYVFNKGRAFEMLNPLRIRSPEEFEKFLQFRYEFVYEVAEIWKTNDLTAIVMPIWPHSGIKAKHNEDMGLMLDYSILWNITGFPAGVLPITRVQENEQSFKDTYNDKWTQVLNEDCKNSAGMPICLQVVGFQYKDEQVLGIMKTLEKAIGHKIDCNMEYDMSIGEKMLDERLGYTLNR